jgi:nitrogen fixation/metabolism regulation signal transduction histidine kinase
VTRHPAGKSPHARIPAERKLLLLALSPLVPVAALALALWFRPDLSAALKLALSGLALTWVLFIAISIRRHFKHQVRTLSTLIEAIRTEDYSLRGTLAHETGDLAELFQQINSLAGQLQQSRQEESELRGLLERIITQLNVAVIAYDSDDRIVLVNHLSEKLMDRTAAQLIGTSLAEHQLDHILPRQNSQLLEHAFPGARGRWQVSRQTYVQNGKQGNLLFIADLEQVLSEEEIKAWQRLIRVIAHEVNNSLTPITSLCQTLGTLLAREDSAARQQDLLQGLEVIDERARNLKNFISDYARIARLPDAQKKRFDLLPLIARVRAMYRAQNVDVLTQETAVEIFGDQTQIEQVLINLVKNAFEANADATKPVRIAIACGDRSCKVEISDEGPGISNSANLFVPFYTTKPQGAGIGLALSRRIVAAHSGDLRLQSRADGPGALATLILPLL